MCILKSMLILSPVPHRNMKFLGALPYFMYNKKRQPKGPTSPDLLLDLHKTKHSTCANCSAEFNEVRNIKFECINPAKQK